MQGSLPTTWDLLRAACRKVGANETQPLTLGNVSVWIDDSGPWEGQVCYLPETSQWDMRPFQEALSQVLTAA
jgi:hypothetical protein